MSCYHPIFAIIKGEKPNGKKDIKFCESEREKRAAEINGKLIKIPCGSCIGCRLGKASNNADQIMLEAKCYNYNSVIHLTYDDLNLPINYIIDKETGEVFESETLKKEDVQKFIKRLKITFERGKYNNKVFPIQKNIRFAYCGEYGSKKERPHYHLILFNFRPHDLKYWEKSKSGYNTYISDTVSKLWGKGIVKINDLSREMAEYIARYITKKWKGDNAKEIYKNKGKVPEFYNCSNRPGIGYMFYEKNKDKIYKTDEIFVNSLKGTRSKKPPKYFDKLLEREELAKMQEIKEQRKINAEEKLKTMLKITGWTEEEYLKMQENARKEKIKALKRQKEAMKIVIDEFGRRKYL